MFGIARKRRCSALQLAAAAAFIACILGDRTSRAAVSFDNPFDPAQCGIALVHAERMLRDHPHDRRAHLVRAEALLCKGLQDDPGALDQAIESFRRAVAADPSDFFSQLYLAEALRARYFLSPDAVNAFLRARSALGRADVGAARPELKAFLAHAIRELRVQQQHFAPVIRDGESAIAAGSASPHHVGQWLQLVALTGPAGMKRALAVLDAYVATHHDHLLDTFYRAELLRGRLAATALRFLYDSAAPYVCHGDARDDVQACFLLQMRLKQMGSPDQPRPPIEQSGTATTGTATRRRSSG